MLENKLVILALIAFVIFIIFLFFAFSISRQINALREEIFEKDNEYLRIAQETNDNNKKLVKLNDEIIKITVNALDKIASFLYKDINE